MPRLVPTLCAAVLGLHAVDGRGQGSISNGNATFALTGTPFDTTPSASFTGVSTGGATANQLFEFGWWFRLPGDTAEAFFPAPTTQSYTGNTATISWANVSGRNFAAQQVIQVTGGGGIIGTVTSDMTITNNAAAPVVFNIFVMADVDLQPTAGNDSAASTDPNGIRLTHVSNTDFIEFRGVGASNYLVRPFGATDVGAVLTNAVVDNFGSTGIPFGPGDFTGGFQWRDVTIAAGASQTFRSIIAANAAAVPVGLESFRVD
jgi:hypothetical protein